MQSFHFLESNLSQGYEGAPFELYSNHLGTSHGPVRNNVTEFAQLKPQWHFQLKTKGSLPKASILLQMRRLKLSVFLITLDSGNVAL